MPNHVHGIIIINKSNIVETQNFASFVKTRNIVETQNFASLQRQRQQNNKKHNVQQNKFGPQSQNLASIIRGFKIGVKKWTTMNKIPFQWQSRFYENIIRNKKSLNKIRKYIINNPINKNNFCHFTEEYVI